VTHKVRTCLWYDTDGLAAARCYVSLIPGSEIEGHPSADAVVVNFILAGTPYQALNGGPIHAQTPAASISVLTEDQAETDRLWAALTAGGSESRCGWLVDRWGVSWQIVPRRLPVLLGGDDPAGAARVQQAMLHMAKIDIATLEAAYAGS